MAANRSGSSRKALVLWTIGIILLILPVVVFICVGRRDGPAQPFRLCRQYDLTALTQEQREQLLSTHLGAALTASARGTDIEWHAQDNSVEVTGVADRRTIQRLEAGLELIELQLPAIRRVNSLYRRQVSARRLRDLSRMLVTYAKDHEGAFPETLSAVHEYDVEGHLDWLIEHSEYIGRGKSLQDSLTTALAYDRSLLQDGKGTNVLFLDTHTEYVKPDRLRALGILPGH